MILKFLLLITVITYMGVSASDINKPITQKLFFYGTIDKQPIRMILDRNNTTFNGFYYTPEGVASDVDINISGTVSENGTLSLKNVNNMLFIGQWKQKPNKTIIIDGTIDASKTAKKKSFHFEQEPIFLDENQKVLTRELFEDYTIKSIRQTVTLNYPEFKNSSLVDQQIINENFYENNDLEALRKSIAEHDSVPPTSGEFSNSYVIKYFDKNYLSVVYNGYILHPMAMHGQSYFDVLNIDLASGELIKLHDLFDDTTYLEIISKNVRAKLILKDTLDDMYWKKDVLNNSAPKEENFQHWTLTPSGIEFFFPPYIFGSFAEGSKQLVIPYKEFGNNFKLQLEGAGLINRKSVDTIDKYNSKVQKIIFSNFHPDSGTEGFSARIRLTLTADGKLTSYRVMSYSENAALNAEVDSLKIQLMDESFPKHPNGEEVVFEIILTAKE